MRGLLGRRSLPVGEGIALRPAWSIHTAFMQFPIDVVFLDEDLVVLKIDAELRPFHTAACRGAREVVELAAGECARRGLAVGDRIAWASQATTTVAVVPGGAPEPLEVRYRGSVLIASRDARYVKLTRFLLDGKGIETVAAPVPAEKLSEALETNDDIDAVVLDANDAVAPALAAANAARVLRPEVPVLIVGETRARERTPVGARIFDKWNESDDLLAALELILQESNVDPELPRLLREDA
jgi:uncharacterized membrane protein (UPF0127 family)